MDDLLKNTNRELQGFVVKYKNAEIWVRRKAKLLQRLFNRARIPLQEFYFDSKQWSKSSMVLAAAVVKQEDVLARNIVSAEMLIEDNTKSIENLVGVIPLSKPARQKLANALPNWKLKLINSIQVR